MHERRIVDDIIIEHLVDDAYYLYNARINSKVLVVSKEICDIVNSYHENKHLDNILRKYKSNGKNIRTYIETLNKYGVLGNCSQGYSKTNNRLIVWLGVTNCCNLKCKYCYIEKNNISMNNDFINSIVNILEIIVHENQYDELVVKFTGGEPLLNLEIVKYAIERMNEQILIKKHYEILTNGILVNQKLIDYIRQNHIAISISLDGNDDYTNRSRMDSVGNTFYDEVMDSIYLLNTNGVMPNIMLTINTDNVKQLPKIADEFIDRHFKFRFSLEKDILEGTPKLLLQEELLIKQLDKVFDVMEEKIIQGNLNWKFKFADVRWGINRTSVCSAGRDYIAFSPDGKIGCCGMGLSKTNIRMDQSESFLSSLREIYEEWNYSTEKMEICKKCIWKKCCAGGCPLQNSVAGNSAGNGIYCNIFKEAIPRLLRIEALKIYCKRGDYQ